MCPSVKDRGTPRKKVLLALFADEEMGSEKWLPVVTGLVKGGIRTHACAYPVPPWEEYGQWGCFWVPLPKLHPKSLCRGCGIIT